jgi:hypothetical protein
VVVCVRARVRFDDSSPAFDASISVVVAAAGAAAV